NADAEQRLPHPYGRSHRCGPEWNPRKNDEHDRYKLADAQWHADAAPVAGCAPGVVYREADSMQPSPDDEVPRGAVPEAAQEHRRHKMEIATNHAAAIPAERHVEIVAQEA